MFLAQSGATLFARVLRERATEDAQKAARRFFEDRQTGERLIEHLFQVRVTYVEPDIRPAEETDGADRGK